MLVIHIKWKFKSNQLLICCLLCVTYVNSLTHLPWYKPDIKHYPSKRTSFKVLEIAVKEHRPDKLHRDPKEAGDRASIERSEGRGLWREELKRRMFEQKGQVLKTSLTTFDPTWSLWARLKCQFSGPSWCLWSKVNVAKAHNRQCWKCARVLPLVVLTPSWKFPAWLSQWFLFSQSLTLNTKEAGKRSNWLYLLGTWEEACSLRRDVPV